MRSPFPWFGGKSRAASIIWGAFGDTPNYVEPFFGSGAVLLNRPAYDPLEHTETVNDLNCFLANFWRAIAADPETVARYADLPVNEADLHARHLWLVNQSDFQERMKTDPDYFDAKIAGWWVWGICSWIGRGWCAPKPPRQLPHLGDNGRGIHRKLPHLGDNGMGWEQREGHPSECDRPAWADLSDIYEYFYALSRRLRRVRVACGDWTRVLGKSPTEKLGITGILLDPPYSQALRGDVYADESPVSDAVREWAIANGNNPMLRIAL